MKLLMVTMRMDIGGAETHIVELSMALAAKGHSVTVVSAGGVYVKELQKRGIRHLTLPLDRKNPIALCTSYKGLKKLISDEKYDIVHAHARIPAFICGKLQKKLHFRFVTTCHAMFRVTSALKKLTDWGEYTFAVSEDIRRYLTHNYRVNPAHIVMTVNGIDTSSFSPSLDGTKLRRQIGIADEPMLLHVSRLDEKSSLCAEALMDSVRLLPNPVTLVIVGGGNREAILQKKASEINSILGRKAVLLVGPRTDIAECIAAADVFIGPSRAAMEALSCGKPAIISGSEGHGGVFDETLAQIAMKSNFCFRQSPLPTVERLAEDITRLLSMGVEERDRLCAYGRTFIEENCSVENMVTPLLSVYSAIAKYRTTGAPDIVICGYYGYGNAGDESMLASLTDGLRRLDPSLDICVLSSHPTETKRRYLVDSVWRFDLVTIRKKLLGAKLFLFGGGNLLQDRTSHRSLIYYTEMLSLAKRCGAKIMIYSNGIGPVDSPKNLDRVKRAIGLADSISLRDRESFLLCKSLVPEKNIRLTFDPAVTVKSNIASCGEGKRFIVIPKRNNKNTLEKTAFLISYIQEKYELSPEIICLYDGEDLSYCRQLSSKTGAPLYCCLSDTEIVDRLSGASFIISSRLHGLVYATAARVPMMSFSDDCKLSAYLDYIGFGKTSAISAVTSIKDDETVLASVADRLMSEKKTIREKLALSLPTLRVMAEYEFQEAVRAAHEEK